MLKTTKHIAVSYPQIPCNSYGGILPIGAYSSGFTRSNKKCLEKNVKNENSKHKLGRTAI